MHKRVSITKNRNLSTKSDRQLLTDIGKSLGVNESKDWYNVRVVDVVKFGGQSILNKCDFFRVVRYAYRKN
jgi:hypothetical protein